MHTKQVVVLTDDIEKTAEFLLHLSNLKSFAISNLTPEAGLQHVSITFQENKTRIIFWLLNSEYKLFTQLIHHYTLGAQHCIAIYDTRKNINLREKIHTIDQNRNIMQLNYERTSNIVTLEQILFPSDFQPTLFITPALKPPKKSFNFEQVCASKQFNQCIKRM